MLLALLIANSEGNILVERFNGVPSEERPHWRSFLVKLGADNLKGVKNEELLVACHNKISEVYNAMQMGFGTFSMQGKAHVDISVSAVTPNKALRLLRYRYRSVYIVYTVLGDVSIFVVGKDEYDELSLSEAIHVINIAVKDACGKAPTERLFLDKYGKICLCLDEIVWKGLLENTDKDRIKRLIRMKPPTEF